MGPVCGTEPTARSLRNPPEKGPVQDDREGVKEEPEKGPVQGDREGVKEEQDKGTVP